MKEKSVDNDETLNVVNEIGEEDRTSHDLNMDFPNKVGKSEEALNIYISEKDL